MDAVRSGRFVLLEHDWPGVHWDLMLEAGDSLRTWALEQPIEEAQTQRVRGLAPHRVVYLDYEGKVSGGRGFVRRRDAGRYVAREWLERRIVVELFGDYVKGEAELSFEDVGDDRPLEGWVFRFRGKVERST